MHGTVYFVLLVIMYYLVTGLRGNKPLKADRETLANPVKKDVIPVLFFLSTVFVGT